jgi:hypothetical protein
MSYLQLRWLHVGWQLTARLRKLAEWRPGFQLLDVPQPVLHAPGFEPADHAKVSWFDVIMSCAAVIGTFQPENSLVCNLLHIQQLQLSRFSCC